MKKFLFLIAGIMVLKLGGTSHAVTPGLTDTVTDGSFALIEISTRHIDTTRSYGDKINQNFQTISSTISSLMANFTNFLYFTPSFPATTIRASAGVQGLLIFNSTNNRLFVGTGTATGAYAEVDNNAAP